MDREKIKEYLKKCGLSHTSKGVAYYKDGSRESLGDALDRVLKNKEFWVECDLHDDLIDKPNIKKEVQKEIKSYLSAQYTIVKEDKVEKVSMDLGDTLKMLSEKYSMENIPKEGFEYGQRVRKNCTPYFIVNTDKVEVKFFNVVTREFEDLSVEAYDSLTGLNIKEAMRSTDGVFPSAVEVFNPQELKYVYSQGEGKPLALNTYMPPAWRTITTPPSNPKIPPFIGKLLAHLFPDKSARDYVIAWVTWATFGRAQTILCLIGSRGTGKTILSDVFRRLVGVRYSSLGSESILTDKFNSSMKNNRLLVLEEVMANEQEHINKLKAFTNNTITLEEKGRDQETIDNFNSIMILANEYNSLSIAPQDRRFSVPEITTEDLKKALSEEEINDFVKNMEEDELFEEIVEFGHYLLQNKDALTKNFSNHVPWKKKHYFEIVRSTLSEWKLFTEEAVVNAKVDRLYISDLSRDFRRQFAEMKFPTTTATLNNFLTDYLYQGNHRLGDLDKDKYGHRYIQINPAFNKPVYGTVTEDEVVDADSPDFVDKDVVAVKDVSNDL